MKVFTITALMYFSLTMYGQNWCPSDAVWTYNYYQMVQDGYTRFTYEKDTVYLGQPCQKVTGRVRYQPGNGDQSLSTNYTFERNDTVFFYYMNEFRPVYYWGVQVGDTLQYRNLDVIGLCDSVLTQVVDSAGTVQINGETLRYYVVRNVNFTTSFVYPETMRVVERFGAVDNHLQPEFACVTDGGGYSLRCYEDDSFDLYQTNLSIDCDFLSGIKAVEANISATLYPNPTQGQINVSVEGDMARHYQLLDYSGKQVFNAVAETNVFGVDISTLPSGIYLLKLEFADGRYAVKRFAKQ